MRAKESKFDVVSCPATQNVTKSSTSTSMSTLSFVAERIKCKQILIIYMQSQLTASAHTCIHGRSCLAIAIGQGRYVIILQLLLTCHLKDMSEDIIWNLFATFNHLNPLLDAVSADHSQSSYCFSVAFSFKRMEVLIKKILQ